MTARTRWTILALAVLGLGLAGGSTWVHYKLLTDPTYVSPCDVNATFNCSQVYLSRYGSFQGIPTAMFGLVWFGLVALIAAFARTGEGEEARGAAGGYIFALSTIGLAVILYLGYASFVVLKAGCLLCLGTYVAVIGIFIVSGLSASSSVSSLPGRLFGDLKAVFDDPATLTVAVLFIAGTASAVAFFPKEGETPPPVASQELTDDATRAFTEAWNAQPRLELGIPADGAKVLIVKFVDWQCPSCKAAHLAYQPILDKFAESHPGAIKQIIKDYPLHDGCNYNMQGVVHIAACESAAAVRMAREQGKADEMIAWFFAQPDQQGFTPAEVKAEAARMLGITDFDARYEALLDAILQDTADGRALNVNSTPTYFVNGVRAQTAQGWLHPQLFELALKIELEKSDSQ